MIVKSLYLSQKENLNEIMAITELNYDELEAIAGRFAPHSFRAGQLRGELVEFADGRIIIRHAFNKKILWELR